MLETNNINQRLKVEGGIRSNEPVEATNLVWEQEYPKMNEKGGGDQMMKLQ